MQFAAYGQFALDLGYNPFLHNIQWLIVLFYSAKDFKCLLLHVNIFFAWIKSKYFLTCSMSSSNFSSVMGSIKERNIGVCVEIKRKTKIMRERMKET